MVSMNVSLTPHLEQFVDKKVRQGTYQTASEVVREGLRLLAERDQRRALELQRLRRDVGVGLGRVENGRVGTLNIKKIKAEGRKRRAARRLQSPGGVVIASQD
ncbi:MAG: type II toxin-antitoxin system ParD family antitoxin [Terriglobales bacterium]